MHIAIIGAGLVGVNTAHALLDAGHTITVIEAQEPAAGASRGNAGLIAHVDILPLGSPKIWRHVPRWVFDPLGPLAIRPTYLPKILPWLARFVIASRPSAVVRQSAAIAALNMKALQAWEHRLESLQMTRHIRRRGFLSVWASPSAFAAARELIGRQNNLGVPAELIDPRAVRTLEPAMTGPIAGGAIYDSGVHVSDPRQLTLDLANAAMQRRAAFVQATVTSIAASDRDVTLTCLDGQAMTADRVVLAAGAWSRNLALSLGDRIPLDTERGYNVTLPPKRLGLTRPVVFEGEGFVTSPLDIGDRVGGAVEFGGLDASPNWARVDAILARLKRFLPNADTSGGTRWMGFRPSLPDSLPVIGRATKTPHVIYAFGHGHYGLTQSAITSHLVAALIDGTRPDIDMAPYRPGRFAGR